MLTIKNLNKSHGNNKILSNINLSIPKNKIIGLVGKSGSGKSTLLRCIQKIETIDSGIITYDGKSGFMFQDFQLFPHLNVIDNIIYATKFHPIDYNVSNYADSLLQKLDLIEKKYSLIDNLSGGQKQRVALARSLILQPSLLLCDEPTSGLDVMTIKNVSNIFKTVKESGVTIIIASHDLEFLATTCDSIIKLEQGIITTQIKSVDLAQQEIL
jgi:polar amino acid transport system ATP-binding protein